MTRSIVVNADDLGRTVGINEGIFEAHERGLVTSATLMVNFPAAGDAAAELTRHARLGVGLHVTLTGATPALPLDEVPSLVDAEGRFPRKPELIERFEPAEVTAEIRRQLAIFVELTGRLPTHLDSHHHAHREPVVLDALVAVARAHSVAWSGAPPRPSLRGSRPRAWRQPTPSSSASSAMTRASTFCSRSSPASVQA